MCVCILGHAKPQNWFDPGVGRYCILLYLSLDNNCAQSFLRSCGIGGDCFGPRYFSDGAKLRKKNTEVQNNHRRIQTMTETKMVQSYYLIIPFWGSYYYILTFYFNIFV